MGQQPRRSHFQTVAEEIDLAEDSPVEVTILNGTLVVAHTKPVYTLEELVARITPQNRHHETDTGSPVSNEVW